VRPLRPAVDRRVGKPKPPRARRPRWRAKFITSGFGASGSTQNVCRAVVPRMVPRLPQPVQWRSMRAAIASAPRGPQSSRRAARDSPELGRGGRHGIRTPGRASRCSACAPARTRGPRLDCRLVVRRRCSRSARAVDYLSLRCATRPIPVRLGHEHALASVVSARTPRGPLRPRMDAGCLGARMGARRRGR